MADNYLITGYWGEPHVTAENDRGINAAIFGEGRFVLPVGEKFRAEYMGNNTIRIHDGKLVDNGAAAGIPTGEYVDLLFANTSQGMKRMDLIVFQYEKDSSTLVETGKFVIVQGEETSGTPVAPELTQGDLLSETTLFEQMPLWKFGVSGGNLIMPPTGMFTQRVLLNASKESKEIIYSQTSASGSISTSTISTYPTKPGVYRVGAPIAGLPAGTSGYGILLLWNAGSYVLHLFVANDATLYTGKTSTSGGNITAPSKWLKHAGTSVDSQ